MGHASARSCKNAFNCCVDIWVFDRFVPGHVLRLSRSLGSPGLRAVILDSKYPRQEQLPFLQFPFFRVVGAGLSWSDNTVPWRTH